MTGDYAWTAAEVWELVKDWLDKARPPHCEWYQQHRAWFDADTYIPPVHAAALHVASGLGWLMARRQGRTLQLCDGVPMCGERVFYCGMWDGPTLLHAISAAIAAVTGATQ